MLNSTDRMDYISGYLSAYENKIKMANKQGLFDAAKMFELFAANVCALWFGQPFQNLNTDTSTYPYVDLISEDHALFIQVTTTHDLGSKIKSTLEKIRDSKDGRASTVTNIVFFVLHNDSVERIPDYTGDNIIGSLSFTKKDNLITTQDLLSKAQTDLAFQSQLFDLFKTDEHYTTRNEELLRAALETSRAVGLRNINCYLPGNYQIDRSQLVDKVKSDNCRFISIQGEAGSGKSAFCKMFLECEELVLYARAERFIEESNINAIWSLDLENTLAYLNGKKLTFFIDALEFIADCRHTKFELLQQLYVVAQKHENIFVVTSCRSSEKSAFIKLETTLGIHSYSVDNLSDTELAPIAETYPVIKKMLGNKAYQSLLRIPFYINFILEQGINPDDVHDEIAFREFIWENIICLKDKSKKLGLKYNEIIQTVNGIVFERARNNLLGIRADKFDSQIINALISEGILVSHKNLVRLKHDTFEDICFEQYFDEQFVDCRGNYGIFFSGLGAFGKCVYRRYQIWIANKLFGSNDRTKFLHKLIFADCVPPNWKKQTEIGIVKSKYCADFFREQGENLIAEGIIWNFVHTANLFAFEAQILFSHTETPLLSFYPIGNGRPELIRLIHKHELFKDPNVARPPIIKLCQDYSKQINNADVAPLACTIAAHYVDQMMIESQTVHYYHFIESADPCLTVIYRTPEACRDWFVGFLSKLSGYYSGSDRKNYRIARDIIRWTMKNTYPQMVNSFPTELCSLFETYWTHDTNTNTPFYSYHLRNDHLFGLNETAESYHHDFEDVDNNPFLINLFGKKLFEGLEWAIAFVNRLMTTFAKNCPDHIVNVEIYSSDTKQTRSYLGNPNMWLVSIDEYQIPTLISDIIYTLTQAIERNIAAYINQDGLGEAIAKWVKTKLLTEANNIALLTIIENIGMHFQRELPGYALELATSINLLNWDIYRYTSFVSNPTKDLLEKQIMRTMGVPSLNHRYKKDKACGQLLRDYVFILQIHSDDNLKQRCYDILDYLYAKIDSENLGAEHLLQVQKMDARNAELEIIDDHHVAFMPHISGKAAEYMEKHTESNEDSGTLINRIYECIDNVINNKTSRSDALAVIEETLISMEQGTNHIVYENPLIMLVALVLKKLELDTTTRSDLCNLWIDGIRRILSNETFAVEASLSKVLFEQIDSNVPTETKNRLKLLILDLLLYKGQNGLISDIANYAKEFLADNESLAHQVLYTIVMISKDEMDCQKYNADYLEKHPEHGTIQFVPNLTPELPGVDSVIREDDNENPYPSQRDAIIAEYLYAETELKIDYFDMANYDLATLCRAANCGLKINDVFFYEVMKKTITGMIKAWHFCHQNHREYGRFDVLDSISEHEVTELFRKQIVDSSVNSVCAINLLFDKMDFSLFTEDAITFYLKIFGHLLPVYIDAWQNPSLRNALKITVKYLEEKISNIDVDGVRIELYKSLFFYSPSFVLSDCSKYTSEYSYSDITFLNEQFSKYGVHHLEEMLSTIYQLRIDKLLPHILLSISHCFSELRTNSNRFAAIIKERRIIVQFIIYKAFIKHSTEIKQDYELTEAYENVLETLVELDYEDAAVLLDEFRLH